MSFFRPYSTLLIGIALGVYVVPKVVGRLGVSLPGA
jgi:hypothetical protein